MTSESAPRLFQTTRWSVVSRSLDPADPEAKKALDSLCGVYWHPLYAYIRRSGKNRHDAQDLTQGFFAHLMQKEILAAADPEKGRLRTFLLTCLRNYMANQHDGAMAQKRGGAVPVVNINPDWEEEYYSAELVDDLTPDRIFQRRWAIALLEHTMQMLREEFAECGKTEIFQALRPFLGFSPDPKERYAEIAATLGISEGTLKNQVFRLRQRWRDLLFEKVAQTLDDPTPEAIRGELMELLGSV